MQKHTHFWTLNKIYFWKLLGRCCVRDRNDYECAHNIYIPTEHGC